MPLYDWKCTKCGEQFERAFPMTRRPTSTPCPECSAYAFQQVSYGGIQADEPAWLSHPHVQGQLVSPYERPISNRSEYKRHLAEKGIAEL